MATVAEMDVIIGAKLDPVNSGLDSLNQKITATANKAKDLAIGFNSVTTSLDKVTGQAGSTASSFSKISTAATEVSRTTINQFGTVVNSFDSIAGGIDAIAGTFNQKWQPIVDGALKAAGAFEEADQSAITLQNTVSKFASIAGIQVGGGVFNFNTQGLAAAVQNIDLLKSEITNIPPITFRISGDTQAALLQFHGLSQEITDLASRGPVSISKLNSALSTLKTASLTATDTTTFVKYESAIEKVEGELLKLKTISATSAQGIKQINPAANSASFAVTNMGRVLQDLPFGFIGIANNLNPLLESFQRLSAESKKTGTSLVSNLLGALTGAGGLGLALSGVTAALSLASFGLSAWTRGFGDSKAAVDEAKKANDDYVKSLQSINEQSVKTAEKDIVSLNVLTQAAQNNALSFQARIDAVNKLQETYPAYFGNLTKEEILYGSLTDQINLATQALINKAFAEAAQQKAVEAGTRAYDLDKKRLEAIQKLKAAQKEYDESLKASNQTFVDFAKEQTAESPQLKALRDAKKAVNELSGQFFQAQLDQVAFLNDTQKYAALTGGINQTGDAFQQVQVLLRKLSEEIDGINRKQVLTGADLSTDKIQAYRKAIEDLGKIPIDTTQIKHLQDSISALLASGVSKDSDIIKGIQKQIANLDPSSSQIQVLLQKIKDLGGTFEETGRQAKTNGDKINDVLKELQLTLHDIDSLNAQKAILAVAQTIGNLGEAIDKINQKEITTNADLRTDKIDAYKKAIQDLAKIPIDTTQIKKLQDEINGLLAQGTGKDSEVIRNIQKQINALDPASGQITSLIQKIRELGGTVTDIDLSIRVNDTALEKILAIESAIKKLQGLHANPEVIIKLETQIEALSLDAVANELRKKYASLKNFKLPEIAPPPIKIPVIFTDIESDNFFQLKGKVEQLAQKLALKLPVNFEHMNSGELRNEFERESGIDEITEFAKQNHIPIFVDLQKMDKKELTDFFNKIKAPVEQLRQSLEGTVTDVLTGFADSLAGVLSGQNPFASFAEVLGKSFEAIGAALIKYGVIQGIINKVFSKPFTPAAPFLMIGAGIALEALGGFIVNSLPHMAEGGIVSSPTLALIGERGKEAVVPLNRMGDIFGSNRDLRLSGEFDIHGDRLRLLLDKTNKRWGRSYGV